MLLNTIQEVKQLLPRLLAKINNNSLMPNMDKAEQKYLLPITGVDLYNQYVQLYQASAASEYQQTILKNMQLVVASHGYLDELAINLATITDSGIQSHQSAALPRVYGWEYKSFKTALQEIAADATDVLIQSLLLNQAQLPAWTSSPAYKTFAGLLIKTGMEFSALHTLHQPSRTFYAIRSVIADSQQNLNSAIGPALVNYFVAANNLSDPEKTALFYLQKALAFYSIKKACEHFSAQITANGFTVISNGGDPESDTAGTTTDTAGSFLTQKVLACERDGGEFLNLAKKSLVQLAKATGQSEGFLTAFNAGPLVSYLAPVQKDKGNDRRKIFRFN